MNTEENNFYAQTEKNKKKIIKWQNKQIKKVLELMGQQNEYFFGLGFGVSGSIHNAIVMAQQDATADLAETNSLFVETVVKMEKQFGVGNDSEEFRNQVYSRSELNVKEIKYKIIDKMTVDDKFYVACIAYTNKAKLRMLFPASGIEQQKRFYNKIDSALIIGFEKKYKEKK